MKNKTKLMSILVFAIIVCASFASAEYLENIAESSRIRITLINQEPDPVAPGNLVDVKFRIENLASTPANNIRIKLLLKYPFSLYSEKDEIKNIGTLASLQMDDIGVKEEWKLLVDKAAATGENTIEFLYSINNGPWINAGEYILTVRTKDAVIAINEVKIDNQLIPGTKTKVGFMVQNLADNSLRNIKLRLDLLTPLVTAASISYNELPFTPIDSGNEKTLDLINPQETKIINFNLFIDATTESKAYKVPYTLTYSDSAGKNFSLQGVVGLIVDSDPDLSITLDQTDIYNAGAKGKVSIKIVNKGFANVKFLTIILNESKDFDLLTDSQVYIGKLDSDDYETADYSMIIKNNAQNPVILPLYIAYRDSNGHFFSKNVPISLKLFSGQELKQRIDGKSSPIGMIFVLIILAVAGFFIYKKIRKAKKKQ